MGKYAIFIVLALTFSLITYSHALKNALFMSNARTVQSYSHSQAQNIAHSAAMMTITSLRNDQNSTFLPEADDSYAFPSLNGFHDWEEMYGSYNVSLINQGDSLLVLQSTGKFEETVYVSQIGLVIGPSIWDPEFDQAVHAENYIELGGNDMIEGDATINSTADNSVRLGSQSKVKIDGDLYIGPNAIPEQVITGNLENVGDDIHNLPKELDYPMPIFPEFPTGSPTVSSVYGDQVLQPSDYEGYYIPEFHLGGNSTVTIHTGDQDRILHVGSFDIQSGTVEIVGDGKLTLYIENIIDMGGNSTVNKNGDLNNLMMYYRGNEEVDLGEEDDVEFGGNTLFNGSMFALQANIHLRGTAGVQGNIITGGSNVTLRGNSSAISRTIYAPNATVRADGNVSIRGSVISDRFIGSGNTTLVYDSELDTPLPDLEQEGGGFDIAYWN
jgi:hypothetical protein